MSPLLVRGSIQIKIKQRGGGGRGVGQNIRYLLLNVVPYYLSLLRR
jgi:hypothetical protein